MAGPSKVITAVEMAEASGIDPKRLRAALRAAHLQWHPHNGRNRVLKAALREAALQC